MARDKLGSNLLTDPVAFGIKAAFSGDLGFQYYAEGLRGRKNTSLGAVFYIFAGDTLIGEITSSGALLAYTWGADGLVSSRVLTGTPKSLWYHFVPQGETRYLTNSSGTVDDAYLYSAYGNLVTSSGSDLNPYRYGGKYGYYTDPDMQGLMLAGQRWYSLQTFRWMTRDPIVYDGGDNVYGYVDNDPLNYIDSDGLAPGDSYPNPNSAARAASNEIRKMPANREFEYAGWIYRKPSGDYSYTMPMTMLRKKFSHPGPMPENAYGRYHNHPSDADFSPRDKASSESKGLPVYVLTRLDWIKKYYPDPKREGHGVTQIIKKGRSCLVVD